MSSRSDPVRVAHVEAQLMDRVRGASLVTLRGIIQNYGHLTDDAHTVSVVAYCRAELERRGE